MTPEIIYTSIAALACFALGAAAAIASYRVAAFRDTTWQLVTTGAGVALKTAAIGISCHQNQTHFFNSNAEIAGLLAWALAFSYLVALGVAKARSLGALILPLIVVLLAVSLTASRQTVDPGIPVSGTFAAHVLSAFLGYGLLLTACGTAVLYLEQASLMKRKVFGRLFQELPSLERLEKLEFLCAVLGLALFTVAIATGSLMARELHKPFWLDPKALASQATWLVFAILIAGRALRRLNGSAAAKFVLAGAAMVVLTFALSHPFARPADNDQIPSAKAQTSSINRNSNSKRQRCGGTACSSIGCVSVRLLFET